MKKGKEKKKRKKNRKQQLWANEATEKPVMKAKVKKKKKKDEDINNYSIWHNVCN